MKRYIFAAVAVTLILSGCEYHPFYDGQKFCIYTPDNGLVEEDGCNIFLPIVSENPYVIELYGGEGRNHTVEISDPSCLSYTYEDADVDKAAGDVIPARITLLPQELGTASLTVTDEDTGESLQFHVDVCEAYNALEVKSGLGSIQEGTVFVFRYGGPDDVVKICSGSVKDRQIKVIAEGRYEFVSFGERLCFELAYPADSDGHPAAGGTEVFRRYVVGYTLGGLLYADGGMWMLNLKNLPVSTRSSYPDMKYARYIFFDVTDMDRSVIPSLDYDPYYSGQEEDAGDDRIYLSDEEFFCCDAAEIFPWIY